MVAWSEGTSFTRRHQFSGAWTRGNTINKKRSCNNRLFKKSSGNGNTIDIKRRGNIVNTINIKRSGNSGNTIDIKQSGNNVLLKKVSKRVTKKRGSI